jgi:hypothetical protein
MKAPTVLGWSYLLEITFTVSENAFLGTKEKYFLSGLLQKKVFVNIFSLVGYRCSLGFFWQKQMNRQQFC